MKARRRILLAAAAVLAFLGQPSDVAARRPHRRSPRVEIVGVARVETSPRRRVHGNGRAFEEFDVTLLSAAASPDQARGADLGLALESAGRVHVVHDLSCGGSWVDLAPGDRVDVKGEYVETTGEGKSVLHFTHPAGSECGTAAGHPPGYLRRR